MLALVGRDMADGGEDIRRMRGASFNAISVVDAALPSFRVYVKVLEVVVEIDGSGAEVSTQ